MAIDNKIEGIVAVVAMSLSSISVIANLSLLKRYKITSGEEKLIHVKTVQSSTRKKQLKLRIRA